MCAVCGVVGSATGRFCEACGSPLLATCPRCGEATSPGARFCGECGSPLDEIARPGVVEAQAASTAIAQRRICSVLFVDLVSFTPLSANRDPEEVRELLSRYFLTASTVIGRYGGVTEKFIGDAVVAVWGTPVATEGDAERAVRAGLELIASIADLGEQMGAPNLAARAGVVTGEVAVTVGAIGQGMVAGDAVNTASRVQAAASPGEVLVDTTTQRLASSAIAFDDAGEHVLKGKPSPEALWSATRVLAGVGGTQRVDGLEAPLIGRDAELRLVKELFHAAAERSTPAMVVVSGPAGVGKSRLGWEFEKYVDGLATTVLWHRGRCLSYGEGVSFWALAEIVRARFGIAEDDVLEVATEKFSEGLARFMPDLAERDYVAPRLGRLLGIPAAGDTTTAFSREELFAGWRFFFEHLAARAPVVLLVEDLQHADAGLLDFLDHIVDWAHGLTVFVLAFTRPEMEQIRPGLGSGRRRTALTLDPLELQVMERLVDALVPGMPTAARARIAAHAQGIPLFAVETIRSLIDRDVVVPHEGLYRLIRDVGELTVPDSLHALLAARLDSLTPDIRDLVADAAVLGTTFPAEALIAVAGRPDAEVRAAMSELIRRQVLEVSADPLSPQRGDYRFSQEMLRRVAYETLSRRDRKARHLAVAEHLRATFPADGDEIMDVVARHYLDALAAVPDDPDVADIRDQAVSALVRAGERATRAGAPAGASASYAAAAELIEQTPEHGQEVAAAELWERCATADLIRGDYAATERHAERARGLFQASGHARAAARAQLLIGSALADSGQLSESREHAAAALLVLRQDPDRDTVTALRLVADVALFSGEADADRLTSEVLALGQDLDVGPDVLTRLLTIRGHLHNSANRPTQATAYYLEAARQAELTGDTARRGIALCNLAFNVMPADPEAAVAAARTAMELLRRVGNRPALAISMGNLMVALVDEGDWNQAETLLTEAASADELDDNELLRACRGWLAALRGDVDTATDTLTALPMLRASEDHQHRATVALVEAFTANAREQPALALRHARHALTHVPSIGVRHEVVRWAWPLAARVALGLRDLATVTELIAGLDEHPMGHLPPVLRAERDLVRARLSVEQGDLEAGNALAGAVAGHRNVANPYHLSHALLDLAAYVSLGGDDTAAATLVDEAAEIADRLRCRPLQNRAQRTSMGYGDASLSPSQVRSRRPAT
jgi:class 3 adenylate cyclase/tetratricopeptide (TPR) repeat protein